MDEMYNRRSRQNRDVRPLPPEQPTFQARHSIHTLFIIAMLYTEICLKCMLYTQCRQIAAFPKVNIAFSICLMLLAVQIDRMQSILQSKHTIVKVKVDKDGSDALNFRNQYKLHICSMGSWRKTGALAQIIATVILWVFFYLNKHL